MQNEIMVSIICNAYNHENYIANAIDSFIMQKTNFDYEILIHDDASTDKTTEIIKSYEKKYPELIKPIYQAKNQYSKGINVGEINRGRAIGKYYALCEGDDYWSNPYKLQVQVDYMEAHPECSACVHAALMVDAKTNDIIGEKRPVHQDKEFSIEEVIKGGGGLFVTNSILYRRNMGEIRPDFYYKNKTSFSDYQLMILLALIGKVYYIDKFMSVYRYNVPGSWTSRNSSNLDKIYKHIKEIDNMLNEVNIYTNRKYNTTIRKTKFRNNCQKIKPWIKQYFPNTAKLLKIVGRVYK